MPDINEKITLERLLRKALGLDPDYYGKTVIDVDWKNGNICGMLQVNGTKSVDLNKLKS